MSILRLFCRRAHDRSLTAHLSVLAPSMVNLKACLVIARWLLTNKLRKTRSYLYASSNLRMRRAFIMAKQQKVTEYQERVYAALQQIPEGRITTYAALSRALGSSPRAVGGALRVNPFAPDIPCHRCIASTGVCTWLHHVAMRY